MLTVGDDDRNEVFTAELLVLILLKMIESIDMTLCVISFLVYFWPCLCCNTIAYCKRQDRRDYIIFTFYFRSVDSGQLDSIKTIS